MSNGIITKIDNLGRVGIPKPVRLRLKLESQSKILMTVDNDKIIIKKANIADECIVCGSDDGVLNFKGKNLCKKCIDEIKKVQLI